MNELVMALMMLCHMGTQTCAPLIHPDGRNLSISFHRDIAECVFIKDTVAITLQASLTRDYAIISVCVCSDKATEVDGKCVVLKGEMGI